MFQLGKMSIDITYVVIHFLHNTAPIWTEIIVNAQVIMNFHKTYKSNKTIELHNLKYAMKYAIKMRIKNNGDTVYNFLAKGTEILFKWPVVLCTINNNKRVMQGVCLNRNLSRFKAYMFWL